MTKIEVEALKPAFGSGYDTRHNRDHEHKPIRSRGKPKRKVPNVRAPAGRW